MSDVSRLFGEYLGAASSAKQAEVSDASAQKQAQFSGGYRQSAANAVGLTPELTAESLIQDFGNATPEEISARSAGADAYIEDASADRGYGQAIGDTSIDVINGALQGALGLGALGAGVVDADAGATVAGWAQDSGDWLTGNQSDELNARRRAHAERNAVTAEHNETLRQLEVAAGGSETIATLKQIGRDFLDGVSNADGVNIQSGSAQGVGSLLLGGVIGKGIKAAGGLAAARTAVGRAGPSAAAFRINQVTNAGAMPAAIGALEGGGAYTQTVNEVMAMGHEQLLEGSPDYQELIRQGWDPQDAKAEVANHAGLTAAAIQAPIGVATGALVSKFEAAPLKATGLGNRVGNVLKETLEEGIQSGAGQLATNVGIQQNADQDRSLSEGVGQAAGEGALYGAGTAGALQAPGVPVDTAKAVAAPIIAGGKKAIDAFEARGRRIQSDIDAEAPSSLVNTEVVANEAAAALAEPGVLDDLRARVASDGAGDQSEATRAIDTLINAVSFDPAEEAKGYENRPGIHAILSGSSDRFEVLKKMSAAVSDPTLSNEDRAGAGLWLRKFTNEHAAETVGRLSEAFEPLDDNDPAVEQLNKLAEIVQDFANSPEINRAIQTANSIVSKLTANRVQNDARWAAVAAQAAIHAPEAVKPEVVDTVLEMANSGGLELTDSERRSLEATAAMLQVKQVEEEQSEKLKLKSSNEVSFDIEDGDDGAEFKSLATHQKLISLAAHVGNTKAARERLEDLMKFAQHMNNKVAAINANLAAGNGGQENSTPYQALSRDTRLFSETKAGMWINPTKVESVRFNQRVGEDARAVVTLANHLAAIHSDLGVKPIALVELDASLQRPAEQVRRDYRERRKAAQLAEQAATPLAQEGPAQPAGEPAADEVAPTQAAEVDVASNENITSTEAEPGVAGEAAPVERQRDEGAAQPETGGVASVEKTNEPDRREVEEKSEVVETQDKSEGESSTSPVDGIADEPTRVDAATPLNERFPNLFEGKNGNRFYSSFKVPGQPISRLLGLGDQLLNTLVNGALKSMDAIREFAGSDNRHFQREIDPAILKDYRSYMQLARPIMAQMQKQLGAFLVKNSGAISEGAAANQWINGKALNLVEFDEAGRPIGYNTELLQGAVTAGLQWLLIANSTGRSQDAEDIAKRFGVDIADVNDATIDGRPADAVSYMNYGYAAVTSKQQLANQIRRFWGLTEASDAKIGNSEGILEAFAGEVLDAMTNEQVNLLKLDDPITIGETTFRRLLPVRDTEAGELTARIKERKADLLEKLVMVEPEETLFIGSPPTKPVDFQMGSRVVKITKQQQALIDRYRKVPHKLNLRMAAVYEALTEDQFKDLFGAPEATEQTNVNHRKSIDGQRITAQSAYESFKELLGNVRQTATEQDVDPSEVEVFYDWGISAVGRLHMLGRNNPQASKILREIILPTSAVIDLEVNPEHRSMFFAAIAQHWGIKIHQVGLDGTDELVKTLAETKFAESVKILQSMGNSPKKFSDEQLAVFKSEFGKDWGPGALHALQDYVRMTAEGANLKAFDTSLYLEADGITDGPINTMVHMGAGRDGAFTPNWVKVTAKGGLFIGDFGNEGRSFADHFNDRENGDPVDLYTTVSRALTARINELAKVLEGHPHFGPINQALRDVMTEMVKDMRFEGGELIIDRGLTKNPVTITVYGSGAKGIAGKLVNEIFAEIYERMSDPNAQGSILQLGSQLKTLTNFKLVNTRQGLKVFQEPAPRPKARDGEDPNSWVNYTFTPGQEKNFRSIVQYLFVDPMVQAMDEVIGETRGNTEAIRDATQIQGIFLEHLFQEEMSQVMKAQDRTDEIGTRKQIQAIYDRLRHMAPFVHTGTQSFFISGSEKTDLRDPQKVFEARRAGKSEPRQPEFGRDFAENFRSSAQVEGPVNPGVKAIATMAIGTGDGQMIQTFGTDLAAPKGLPVFDGFNFSIADAKAGSEKMNKAVFDAWKLNPLAAVAESFAEFVATADFSTMSDAMVADLGRVLFEDGAGTKDEIIQAIKDRSEQLTEAALVQQARKNVLARTTLRVDHMASAEASHENKGQIVITTRDPAEIANRLNAELDKELVRLRKDKPGNKQVRPLSENIAKELSGLGALNESSGARTAEMSEVRRMARGLDIPHEHKKLLDSVLKQLADSEYQLVTGTLEQINAERALENRSPLTSNGVAHGFTLAGEKRVYLINPSSETLVHELVHAVTYDRVFAYYNDPASLSQVQKDAVERIEAMMGQWIEAALESEGKEITSIPLQTAYRDALRAINGHLGRGNKAAALNEFMAWNLANRDLIAANRKLSVVGTLAEIARNVIEAIKSLVWGRAKGAIPPIANDLYSNLRFNTEVLMNSAPLFEQKIQDGEAILEHSTNPGDISRLQSIRAAFEAKLERTITAQANPFKADMRRDAIAKQLENAVEVADIFRANGFPMDPLQKSTFENVVLALMADADLNPNALLRTQQIYASVMKTLKVEDFVADPDTASQGELHLAREKLNTLRGLSGSLQVRDAKKRSALMAAFLGVAMVDEGFRAVLAKLPVPRSEKSTDKTLDAFLENVGIEGLDRLSTMMSGEQRATPSIQAAIDALFEKMTANKVDNANYVDQFVNKAGAGVDTFNDLIVNSVNNASRALYDRLDSIEEGARNRVIAILARYGKAVTALVNEDLAEGVADGVISGMNREEIPTILRELVTEIMGRTQSNKTIYDMIKAVRTFVQQTRQQFREHLPKQLSKHFTRELSEAEWASMYHGLAKTDLASIATAGRMNVPQLLGMLKSPSGVQREINRLETQLQAVEPTHFATWQAKAEQLANYMTTGIPGDQLLRNAHAIGNLNGVLSKSQRQAFNVPAKATIDQLDQLISLYAVQKTAQTDPSSIDALRALIESEPEGMGHIMGFLVGQRRDEMAKVAQSPLALQNHFKGHVPTEQEAGTSLVVALDKDHSDLRKRGYVRVGPYEGSTAEKNAAKKSYYFAPVSGRAMYMQGIMQNVRQTAYGVDPRTGFANGVPTAGVIKDVGRVDVRALKIQNGEPLLPVFDSNGEVVAYERSLDPVMVSKLAYNDQMHEVLGIWRGRQVEEGLAQGFNEQLIERLGNQWRKERGSKKAEYVNLFSKESLADPVLADSVGLLTDDAREMIEAQFGRGNFWVRRDMINDALGYRSPSVSDLWTGITRWSPEVQTQVQNIAMGIFGKDAFARLVRAEQTYQTFITDARVTIVVKSVVVPIANIMSNVYHLVGRGVPLKSIAKGFPAKAAEVDFFIKNRLRRMELQAQERAAEGANNLPALHKIQAELKSILDSNRRLSIWPLIEAGEFASISDAGISQEEIELSEGRLSAYMEKLTDKLPKELQTAAKYGLVSRDTALFKGLQRAVEYGDFLAKAVLYDDLVGRQGKDHEYALGKITEEFINYDRQPGRWRSGLENMGLLWFWNFKLRAAKVALSVLRNNPLHLFLAGLAPTPEFLGLDVGTPVSDNFVSVIAEGKQGWSIGLDQGFRAHMLNPWVNLFG